MSTFGYCAASAGRITTAATLWRNLAARRPLTSDRRMRAAQQPPSNPPDALPKNPFADSQAGKPPEATTTSEAAKPVSVIPEPQKPADAPAATANGHSAVNGDSKTSALALVPAADKPAAPALSLSATNNASEAPSSSATSVQPPVMTGALPPGDKPEDTTPKPAESTEADGVNDISAVTAASEPSALNGDDKKEATDVGGASPSAVPGSTGASIGAETGEKNDTDLKDDAPPVFAPVAEPSAVATTTGLGEKKDVDMEDAAPSSAPAATTKPSTTEPVEKGDVEMQDAAPAAPSADPAVPTPAAPVTTSTEKEDDVKDAAPATDVVGTASTAEATPAAAPAPVTGGKKRKADDEADVNGACATEEPAAKKQKGTFARAVAKAKEAVHDVKEKATPKRKGTKKEKKERPPVGRTERKTRSQGRAD